MVSTLALKCRTAPERVGSIHFSKVECGLSCETSEGALRGSDCNQESKEGIIFTAWEDNVV